MSQARARYQNNWLRGRLLAARRLLLACLAPSVQRQLAKSRPQVRPAPIQLDANVNERAAGRRSNNVRRRVINFVPISTSYFVPGARAGGTRAGASGHTEALVPAEVGPSPTKDRRQFSCHHVCRSAGRVWRRGPKSHGAPVEWGRPPPPDWHWLHNQIIIINIAIKLSGRACERARYRWWSGGRGAAESESIRSGSRARHRPYK